jgi:hypothetical protein
MIYDICNKDHVGAYGDQDCCYKAFWQQALYCVATGITHIHTQSKKVKKNYAGVITPRQKKLPSVEVRLKRLKSTEGFSTCCAIAQRLISTATPVDFNRG